HVDVVGDVDEVKDRRSVRTHEHEIVELAVLEHDLAADHVIDDGLAVEGNCEPDDRVLAFGGLSSEISAAAVVSGGSPGFLRVLPARVEVFRRAEAPVRVTAAKQPMNDIAIVVAALGLKDRTFVPDET